MFFIGMFTFKLLFYIVMLIVTPTVIGVISSRVYDFDINVASFGAVVGVLYYVFCQM